MGRQNLERRNDGVWAEEKEKEREGKGGRGERGVGKGGGRGARRWMRK